MHINWGVKDGGWVAVGLRLVLVGLRLVAPLANLDTRLEVTDSKYNFDGSQTERFGGQI